MNESAALALIIIVSVGILTLVINILRYMFNKYQTNDKLDHIEKGLYSLETRLDSRIDKLYATIFEMLKDRK